MEWKERVVFITGASSGIGKGLALELARRGAKLALVARRRELLDEIAAAAQTEVLAIAADVKTPESMRAAAQDLVSKFGRIDLLIANAGIGGGNDAAVFDVSNFANVIEVNLIGVANTVAAVLPDMLVRGSGHLSVISSLAAYRGLPKSAAYCASKAAVSAFFESLRLDLSPRGVDVTIIHPGFIKTPLTAGRTAKLPFLMELDDAVNKILWALEHRKKSYSFPWQLATVVRAGMIMPNFMYHWIPRLNSFRE